MVSNCQNINKYRLTKWGSSCSPQPNPVGSSCLSFVQRVGFCSLKSSSWKLSDKPAKHIISYSWQSPFQSLRFLVVFMESFSNVGLKCEYSNSTLEWYPDDRHWVKQRGETTGSAATGGSRSVSINEKKWVGSPKTPLDTQAAVQSARL